MEQSILYNRFECGVKQWDLFFAFEAFSFVTSDRQIPEARPQAIT